MSAISPRRRNRQRQDPVAPSARHPGDPRVVRTRAAVVEAARTLFLQHGYGGTTMEDIAAHAGVAKRTLYNNYSDKSALFTEIVAETMAYAEDFARGLRIEFSTAITREKLAPALRDLARRMTLGIVRPDVVALRRLLIGEARTFPALGGEYFDRAPGRVLDALASGFQHLTDLGHLEVADTQRAAEQFAYLVAGAPLDRAILVGTPPLEEHLIACAHDGVETFLARYGVRRSGGRRKR